MEGLASEVERLGPYLLLHRLAPYGMVQPYVARREGSIDLVVVKRLLPQLSQHPTAPKRFAREARLTRQLQNRHLVRTLDVGYAGDELFMVTEFVAGVRLDLLMSHAAEKGRPLPLDVVAGVSLRVLNALAYAHGVVGPDGRPLALVHRDLTPRSVTVAFNGDVKLGDFGVARSQWDSALTAPGTTVGTLAYMSPEQVGQGDVDARTDLYGFSVVLYELLTGRPMIEADNALSMLRMIKDVSPAPLSQRRRDLPQSLTEVVQRGLAKAPDQRWPDARAYESALQEALQAVAPPASTERLGAFVRACLPQQEEQFLEVLDRVRALSASLPSEDPAELRAQYDRAPVPQEDEPPPPEPTPEPSVMTMPGTVVPVPSADAPVARPAPPHRLRHFLIAALVVMSAAVVTVAAWRLLVAPGRAELIEAINEGSPVGGQPSVAPRTSEPTVTVVPASKSARPADSRSPERPGEKPSSASSARLSSPSSSALSSPSSSDPAAGPRPIGRRASSPPGRAPSIARPSRQASPAAEVRTAGSPGRLAEFARRLEALRQSEGDARAFDALLLDMKRAAEGADAKVQRAVLRDLSAAERAFDVEGLAQALRRLQRYDAAKE